jgi:wobble nucleotide-excising tRNase
MIESITIANTANYVGAPVKINKLNKINYFFGSNGTGKTTVGRIISNSSKYPSCNVAWKGGTPLQQMVYNNDFVEKNFHQSVELKGVFTLGEEQVDTLSKIEVVKEKLDKLTKSIEKRKQDLLGIDRSGGKKGELTTLEVKIKEKVWELKLRLDGMHAQSAFKGNMGSKESFKAKVLQEFDSNKSLYLPVSELERKAQQIFEKSPAIEAVIATIDVSRIISHETNKILKKIVVGKGDVDIAAMIEKLGNSDWVRAGRVFYDTNNGFCPFCQQSANESLSKNLNEYFDEAFMRDSEDIDNLINSYRMDGEKLQQQLVELMLLPSKFLDLEKIKIEKERLDAKIAINIQRITGKKKEPSQTTELDSLSDVCIAIKSLIDSSNIKIAAHNKLIANLSVERTTLTAQVWKFVLEELKTELATYKSTKTSLEKAILAMTADIERAEKESATTVAELRGLEKQKTSVQPTIDGINNLLDAFGFQSFKIAKTVSGTSYKIVRSDGSEAKATLSEGEKTFVTFLYFYHMLKGSDSETGMTTNRIVVFDDPVSSLDSDILFIVSSLIKGLFDEVRNGVGCIKQIFILTHNVYFHKEVTFNIRRQNKKAMHGEETFWVVRKSELGSVIDNHDCNPVNTSYDLLWAEVRRSDFSILTIQNTLRRILENYFKILGGIDSEKICAFFEGRDRIVCKSLFSWVNDGSHFAHDDIFVSGDSAVVGNYLKVFREIFKRSGHLAHYSMMMGDAFVEDFSITAAESSK